MQKVDIYSFNGKVAQEYGVPEAIFLNNLKFWITHNKANGKNMREGRTWSYNTFEAFAEMFPFWTERQIRTIVDKLVEKGVILKENRFNRHKNDRTNWYAFVNENEWISVKSPFDAVGNEPEIGETNLSQGTEPTLWTDGNVAPELDSVISTDKSVAPESSSTDRKVSPTDISDTSDLTNLSNDNIHSLPTDINTEEDKPAAVNPFELLLNKKPLEAFLDGTADKLSFDFNDTDLVNSKIMQLFRMFVRDVQPPDIHIAWIRKELMDDLRQELTRKVCWVIILIAFMEYPGTEKKYQNVNSLIKRIGWKKDDFIQEFYAHKKRVENMKTRAVSKAAEKEENEKNIEAMLNEAREKLERYKHKLSLRQVNEITELISKRNFLQVNSKLIEFIEEEAA